MNKILVVDHSLEARKIVVLTLEDSYEIILASTLLEAKAAVQLSRIDLILLDIDLPDGSGFEFCNLLKTSPETEQIPIIFLTSKGGIKDKMMAFSLGADDYLVAPYEPMELRARVKLRLKCFERVKKIRAELRIGDLLFIEGRQKVYIVKGIQEQQVDLTPVEYRLLHFFAAHEEDVLNRNQLLEAVWPDNLKVYDRTVDTHISNLRRKIQECQFTIKSIHGIGYSFSKKDS